MKPRIVGESVLRPLKDVKPNTWNPNSMTDFEKESLKTGLLSDGWLASQALLIWRTDDEGNIKNIIIDGEHRWRGATELGFTEGPMVFLDGVPEAEAKALTIKMDAKRGKFKQEPLAALLKEIQFELPDADLSLGVGIPQEELMRMLTLEPTKLEPLSEGDAASHSPIVAAPTEQPAMQQGHVSLVQLFYGKDDHVAFLEMAKKIADKHGSKNISETVLAAFKQATA